MHSSRMRFISLTGFGVSNGATPIKERFQFECRLLVVTRNFVLPPGMRGDSPFGFIQE